jgi:hypothetical protein
MTRTLICCTWKYPAIRFRLWHATREAKNRRSHKLVAYIGVTDAPGRHRSGKRRIQGHLSRFSSARGPAFYRPTAAPREASSSRMMRATTPSQSSIAGCLNSRAVGYQGLSSRPSSHRQSATYCRRTHTGLPMAPAGCTTDVSDEMTRSSKDMIAAVSPKSSIASPNCMT